MAKSLFLGFVAVCTLLFTSCDGLIDKIKEISLPYTYTGSYAIPSEIKAGETFTKELVVKNDEILKIIKDGGGSTELVKKIEAKIVTFSVPDNAGWTFADVEAAELFVGDTSIGKMKTGATGIKSSFDPPAQLSNLKSLMLTGTDFKIKIVFKAKNNINPATITGVVEYAIGIEL